MSRDMTLAVKVLWRHYRETEEKLDFDALQRQVEHVQDCLEEGEKLLHTVALRWRAERECGDIERDEQLYQNVWEAVLLRH